MSRIDYRNTIQDALDAVGRTDGPLGSGSAIALALSLGVECLALQWSLTTSLAEGSDHAEYHGALGEHLRGWRAVTQQAFIDDATHFGIVITCRQLRDASADGEKRTHVESELDALECANGVLLRLIDVSLGLEYHADLMFRGSGAGHARGEAATAGALASAATNALASMLAANVRTVRQRASRYGVETVGLNEIWDVAQRIPHAAARQCLEEELVAASPGKPSEQHL
jgi:hypothetical protein